MNTRLLLAASALTLLLPACKHMDSKEASTDKSLNDEYDMAYINEVEQISRSRGVIVKWVNPPPAKADDD